MRLIGAKKKITRAAAVAAASAALLFIPGLFAEDGKVAAAVTDALPVYGVKTAAAAVATLEACLEVNGDIVSAGQVAVLAEATGKLVAVKAALGTRVRQGDLIAQVDPSSAGTRYLVNGVYAPISGILCAVPLAVGSTVGAGSVITAIAPAGDLQIEARIPEREVGQLRPGLTATVTLPAFPGETFAATVTQVSPILDAASRTKKIVLRFDAPDDRINAGMFGRIKLTTRTYPDVVTIPAEALVQPSGPQDGAASLWVLRDGKVEARPVVPGVTVNHATEVKSGLSAGEAVVVQGQQFLADGVAVLVRP
jgi:multidrug efflux pump subunit AcrA (membrane-fusion protein)